VEHVKDGALLDVVMEFEGWWSTGVGRRGMGCIASNKPRTTGTFFFPVIVVMIYSTGMNI
jgi:hypothetical protein